MPPSPPSPDAPLLWVAFLVHPQEMLLSHVETFGVANENTGNSGDMGIYTPGNLT